LGEVDGLGELGELGELDGRVPPFGMVDDGVVLFGALGLLLDGLDVLAGGAELAGFPGVLPPPEGGVDGVCA
jgi:hypothetical protein